jgi:hypothetical protein
MWNGKNGAFKAYATLRVSGDGLDPSTVSEALGLSPSKAEVSAAGFGIWSYSTRDQLDNLRPLEEHVLHLVQILEQRSSAVIAVAEKFPADVFCYFASQSDVGGFRLSSDTLSRLARLHLSFDVDEYFCCDDSANAEQTGSS